MTPRLLVFAALLCACSSSDPTSPVDPSSPDASRGDASALDTSALDAAGPEASDAPDAREAASPDGGESDAGALDAAEVLACASDETACAGACAKTASDPKNCGACGKACAAGEICLGGACSAPCDYPTKACSGKCVNILFDEGHCGDCGKKCPTGSNGTPGCTGGSCVFSCTAPYANCNDDAALDGCEVNLTSDDKNCGACGKACTATEACVGSKCECKTGNLRCGAACVDVTADATNCGACGKACAAGEACASSACVCKAGLTRCTTGGGCIDTKTDVANCGACGAACPSGNVCSDGACCPAGKIRCGSACVDPTSDVVNCGGCGVACGVAKPYCSAGACETACAAGLTDCGYACLDLTKDVKNCGACYKACLGTELCMAGACTMVGFPGSTIVSSAQGTRINGWIGSPTQVWKLCYSKAIHGATSSAFHAACDGKGASVTLARLSTGKVIGGYNTASWVSTTGTYIGSSANFLFSVTNDFKHAWPGTSTGANYAYSASSYGPTFGGGHDFYVGSTMNSGYCNLGFTYACRTGAYSTATCRDDFCGNYNAWTIDALEVWVK